LACWFRRLVETLFYSRTRQQKVVIARARSPAREGECAPRIQSLRSASFDRNDFRTKYKTDAIARTIPFTANSRTVACARIQMIATMANAGAVFMPGKLKG